LFSDYLAEFAGKPVQDWTLEVDDQSGDDDDEDSDSEGNARRFEFKEGTSSKFWEITLDGESFTVCYGRIGTDGVSQTKDFDSDEKAKKEYDKLILEKQKKGYQEVGSNSGTASGGVGEPIDPTNSAYRLALTWEQEEESVPWTDVFSGYLAQPGAEKTTALVIGKWGNLCEQDDSAETIDALVDAKDRLPHLRALFLGDVISEDCEVSWINQSDVSAIFAAFPNLTEFGVRGADKLSLGTINHSKLEKLVVQCGGLPKSVLEEVLNSDLPQLQHLELYLGTEDYGADTTVGDFKELLEGKKFPKLRYLGLRNSEIADQLAEALIGAPILQRIDVLDLSLGTLSDEGAQKLLDNPDVRKLKRLDLHYHYMSDEMRDRLLLLPIEVDAGDSQFADQGANAEDRYVAVGE
jgi:predicted DNA-binding WGR domain protein